LAFPQLIGLADLDKILNAKIYKRSEAFVKDMQPKLNVFVATEHYFSAHEKIGKHNYVVLDGPPESGKSFIGAAITLSYSAKGFEIISIQKPEEIFSVYEPKQKQIFFADDAVGTIYFDPSLGDFWSRNLPIVLRKLDKNHKLIWTARMYILQEAIESTKLGENIDNFPGIHEVLVEVGDLTKMDKALILYNHAKIANLSMAAKEIVRKNSERIIEHPNYTPERIRQLVTFYLQTGKKKLSTREKKDLENSIFEFLKNPSERFIRAYNKALTQSEKTLLLAVLDQGSKVEIKKLKEEYEKRISALQ
jgi:hypothetical protein